MTSFGGPIARIRYFRSEFVDRRRWLGEQAYADLVAVSQFLPGPASSQVGFSLGLMRAGCFGGEAAWMGFTLPSAAVLIAFAYGARAHSGAMVRDSCTVCNSLPWRSSHRPSGRWRALCAPIARVP